jgi:hypothetical protein
LTARTSSERKSIATEGAHMSWANTLDRTARTAPGRAAFNQRFLDAADGDPIRAEHLRKAYFARMSRLSAKARRKAPRPVPEGTDAGLETLGGGPDAPAA